MVRKFKYFLFYILSSFSKPVREERHRIEAKEEEQARWNIELTDRTEEKIKAYKEWSKAENIAARRIIEAEQAKKALEVGLAFRKAMGLPDEDEPIPPDSELPDFMRGQLPSTVRSWLRYERERMVSHETLAGTTQGERA